MDRIIWETNTRLNRGTVIKITYNGKSKDFRVGEEIYIAGGGGGGGVLYSNSFIIPPRRSDPDGSSFYTGYGGAGGSGGAGHSIKYELIEILELKSKEEVAAEESVAKAKEALKAAENALKVVKEQNK